MAPYAQIVIFNKLKLLSIEAIYVSKSLLP